MAMLSSLLPRPARAQEPKPVRLEYAAPAACPDAAQFELKIRHFLPGLALARAGEHAPLLRVEIAPDGQSGGLRSEQGLRQTEGEDCAEVAQLLAFAVALAIDPNAREPAANAAEPAPPVAPPPPPPPAPTATPEREPRKKQRPHWGFVAGGSVATALAPHVSFGAAGALEGFGFLGRGTLLRAGAGYWTSADVVVDDATVELRSWLGLLEGCPLFWRTGALGLAACLRVDAGVRTASASNIPAGRSVPRPWLSVGPSAHGRVRLAGPLFFDLGASLVVPVLHDHVFLQPNFTVHDVPWAGFVGEMGLGVEFGDQNRE
jgi:hypothetical protein